MHSPARFIYPVISAHDACHANISVFLHVVLLLSLLLFMIHAIIRHYSLLKLRKLLHHVSSFPRVSTIANEKTRSVRARKRSTLPKEFICQADISMRNARRQPRVFSSLRAVWEKGPRCDSAGSDESRTRDKLIRSLLRSGASVLPEEERTRGRLDFSVLHGGGISLFFRVRGRRCRPARVIIGSESVTLCP